MPKPIDDQFQDDSAEVGGVLDNLFAEVTADSNAAADALKAPNPADNTPAADDTAPKPDDQTPPDTDQTPADDGLPPVQPDDQPVSRIPSNDTPAVDGLPASDDTPPAVSDDPVVKLIEEFKLKETASTKSRETFENLKRLSAEAVRLEKAATAKLREDYEAKLAAASKVVADPTKVPAEVETELAELRKFKATFDVENDPEFQKQIEAKVAPRKAANYETVYGVLKNHGLPESELKALREMSEPERVSAIGDLVEKLPRGASRFKVEAKLMDNLNLDDERERAVAEVREKAAKTKQEFRDAPEKIREQYIAEVKAEADKYRTHAIFKKAEVTAQTPPEEKKRIEAHNAAVDKYVKLFDEGVNDDTPAVRAENALGLVLAHQFKAQLDAVSAAKGKLEKELAEIKKRSGLSDVGKLTNTPPNNRPPEITTFDAGESLDALARQAGIL